jgi:hypothetical protein
MERSPTRYDQHHVFPCGSDLGYRQDPSAIPRRSRAGWRRSDPDVSVILQNNPRQIEARVASHGGSAATTLPWLRVQNRHYFHRLRIDDDDLIGDHEIFKAPPFWFDLYDRPRQSGESNGARHLGAD